MSQLSTKIVSNTIYQLIGKIVSMSVTILVVYIVTRTYGREAYGAFSLMQTWPALFFVIVDFGINAVATKELSQDWSKAEKLLGNILIIRVLFSFALMALLAVVLWLFPYSAGLKFGIMLSLFLILTQALYATTNIVFQVKLRYDLSTIGYLTGYAAILVFILVFSYFLVDVKWISFSYVIGGFITFLVNWKFVHYLGLSPKIILDKDTFSYLLITSLPLGLMFVFSQINFKVDSILLSVLQLPVKYGLNNTESVAVYSLPYKIFEVALVIPTFFMNSVFPVMVKKMVSGRDELKSVFLRSMVFLVMAAVVGSILGIIFAPLVINFLGGKAFYQSVLALRILLAGLILYYATQPLAWLIVTLGGQKKLPYVYLVSAVFNVTANYVFIQKYSFYASAVITHVSEFLILCMLLYVAARSWRQKYVKA